MTVGLGDWSMWFIALSLTLYKTIHVFIDDWKIIMVTYCSKMHTSEPAFTPIINQSEKKNKVNVWQKQRKNLQALKTFRTPGLKKKCC